MNISKKSWHYKLYDFANTYASLRTSNIDNCRYVRRVIGGIILAPVLVLIGSTLLIVALDPIISSIMYILGIGSSYFFTLETLLAGSTLYITFLLSLVYAVLTNYLASKIVTLASREGTVNTTALVQKSYRAYKDKYCIKVKFK